MTVFTLPVVDPLCVTDNNIIPRDKDCITFWKKTLASGQSSKLYEIFQQTAQDLLFRAQIQTVSDVDIVSFVRFLCCIEAIGIELIKRPDSMEKEDKSVSNTEIGESSQCSTEPVECEDNSEDKIEDVINEENSEPSNIDEAEEIDEEVDEVDDDDWKKDEIAVTEVEEIITQEEEEVSLPCSKCEEKFNTTWDYDLHFFTKHAPEPIPVTDVEEESVKVPKKSKRKSRGQGKRKRENSPDESMVMKNKKLHKYQSKRLHEKYGFDEVLNRDCPAEIRDLSNVAEENDVKLVKLKENEISNTEESDEDEGEIGDGIDLTGKEKDTENIDGEAEGSVDVRKDSAIAENTAVNTDASKEIKESTGNVTIDGYPAPKRGRPRGITGSARTKRAYPCQICSQQILGVNFKDHMLKIHKLDSGVTCSTCNKTFYNYSMFLEHVERHRARGLQTYTCSICGKKLKNVYLLEYHEKAHSTPEQCSLCMKTFSTPGTLKRHMTVHTQETRFKCQYCPKEFYHANKCKKHEASHLERTHKCDLCGIAFHFKAGLQSHMNIHNPNRELVHCDICQKSFKAKGNLNTHIRQVHQKIKTHPCSICGIKFGKMSTRKRHEATHTDVKPHQCEICGKNFREKGHLKRHVEWHKGEQKHMCDVCGRLFSFKDNMLKHRRIHTGETPYSCDMCSQSFSYIEQLKKHKKKLHTVVMADDVQFETTLEVPACKSEQLIAQNSIISDAIQACLTLDIGSTIEIVQ